MLTVSQYRQGKKCSWATPCSQEQADKERAQHSHSKKRSAKVMPLSSLEQASEPSMLCKMP